VIDSTALHLMLGVLTGWLDRQEREAIAYLIEENWLLRRQLGGRRLRLTDDDRRRLAARAFRVGRAALREIATIATPDMLLRWHRPVDRPEMDIHQEIRRSGRRGVLGEIRRLVVVRMATENPTGGYTRIQGALKTVAHQVGRSTISANPEGGGAAARPAASHLVADVSPAALGRDCVDGSWLAPQGTGGLRQPGRDEPENIRTPTRDRGAPATREEAHGTSPARPLPASKRAIHLGARASARWTRQNQDSASGGSRPRVCAVAATPVVPAIVPSRFHAWRRLQDGCALDGRSSCPHTSPHRLTPREVLAIKEMVTAVEYRHVPTGTLAVLAQRLGKVCASPSTWYRLVRKYGWRRPRLRVHPAKPKVGLRTTRANEMWHIDTTVIRLLDGSRAYLHAVIDNFSRRILAWRVADTFSPANSVAVLVEASRTATSSKTTLAVLADPASRT
jgi:Integrase core domain